MLLDQIDALTAQIDTLTTRIDELIAAICPPAPAAPTSRTAPAGSGADPARRIAAVLPAHASGSTRSPASARERPGHRRRDRPGHDPVPHRRPPGVLGQAHARAPSSPGPPAAAGKTGKGNPYLKGVLGEAAAAAAKTDTFLGERYRRIVKRRGKLKALVAVARSILVIVWHLLADPTARFHDLGADYHTSRIDTEQQIRNHVRQLQALGYTVTLEPAA